MSDSNHHIHDQADAFVHGLLDVTSFDRVQAHCETCPACKQAVEEARAPRRDAGRTAHGNAAATRGIDDAPRHGLDPPPCALKKRILASFVGISAAAALLLLTAQLYTQHMKVSPYDLAVYGQTDLLAATSASLRVRLVDHNTNRPVAGVPISVELLVESRAIEPTQVASLIVSRPMPTGLASRVLSCPT